MQSINKMRSIVLIAAICCSAYPVPVAGQIPPTPGPQDIPKPIPVEISLAGDPKPDITRYLNLRTAAAPSLSPDGSHLAFVTTITGQRQLWVIDTRGGWPQQITFGEDGITFHQWSPRGDWIVYGADRGGNEREAFYLITPDGARERELLPPSQVFRQFGGFSPDGSMIAYATTSGAGVTFDIHVLEVDTGDDRLIQKGRMGLYVASWSPDGRSLLLTERRGEDANDIFLLHLETGESETLFSPEIASSYSRFAWLPDGSGFYLATNQDREFTALAFYDLNQRLSRFIEAPDHDVKVVSLSKDGQYLVWITNEGGYSVFHVKDLARDRELSPPVLPRGIYRITWAARSPVATITVRGPQIPGDTWMWNPRTGSAERVTFSATAGLDPQTFIVPEHVDFSALDNVTLHGLLYVPKNIPTGMKPPVLLAVHGGPTGQARPRFNAVHQYLLARGIVVFDLNFRGSTGYGKTFTRLDNKRLRPNAVRDVGDALDFLAASTLVDTSHAAIMGGSYGGYMTFAALTSLPNRFKGGVSFVGVSNWVTALEGASPQLKASDRVEYGDINDDNDREFFRQISPITHVDRVSAPLMVIHGANDPRDPVTESDQFVRAIREQGGEVEYLRFPDEGHGIRKLPNRVTAYRRVAVFLERVLELNVEAK